VVTHVERPLCAQLRRERAQPRLVLGVHRDGQPRAAREVRLECFVGVDEQRARRGPHEDLDPAREVLDVARHERVFGRRAEEEAPMGPAAAFGAGVLVEQRRARDGRRLGVGHLKQAGHAAGCCRATTGF